MANVPLNTQFIGFSSTVNMTERKSALINAETQAYTMQDIADSAGTVSGSVFQDEVIYYGGESVFGISLGGDNILSTQLLCPNLVTVTNSIVLYIYDYSYLELIDFPKLEEVGSPSIGDSGAIYIQKNERLQVINFNSLKKCTSIGIYESPQITSLDLSSLESADVISVGANISLQTIDISGLISVPLGMSCNFAGNALTQESVDAILYQFAVIVNLNGGGIYLDEGTNAAPSVTGQGYIATLVSNGCTVYTN